MKVKWLQGPEVSEWYSQNSKPVTSRLNVSIIVLSQGKYPRMIYQRIKVRNSEDLPHCDS